jgi:hypothetical protein
VPETEKKNINLKEECEQEDTDAGRAYQCNSTVMRLVSYR